MKPIGHGHGRNVQWKHMNLKPCAPLQYLTQQSGSQHGQLPWQQLGSQHLGSQHLGSQHFSHCGHFALQHSGEQFASQHFGSQHEQFALQHAGLQHSAMQLGGHASQQPSQQSKPFRWMTQHVGAPGQVPAWHIVMKGAHGAQHGLAMQGAQALPISCWLPISGSTIATGFLFHGSYTYGMTGSTRKRARRLLWRSSSGRLCTTGMRHMSTALPSRPTGRDV